MTVVLHKPEEDIMSLLLLNKRDYKYISAFVQKLMLLHVDDKYHQHLIRLRVTWTMIMMHCTQLPTRGH